MVLRGVGKLLSLCSVLTCCRWWPAECPAEPGMWRPFGRKAARIAHAGSEGVLWLIVALQDSYDKSLSRLEHQRTIVCIRASDCKAKHYTARSVGHRTCHKRGLTQWQTEDQHNGSRLSYTIWGPFLIRPPGGLLPIYCCQCDRLCLSLAALTFMSMLKWRHVGTLLTAVMISRYLLP